MYYTAIFHSCKNDNFVHLGIHVTYFDNGATGMEAAKEPFALYSELQLDLHTIRTHANFFMCPS